VHFKRGSETGRALGAKENICWDWRRPKQQYLNQHGQINVQLIVKDLYLEKQHLLADAKSGRSKKEKKNIYAVATLI
jgi:hypothetical protein